MSAFQLDAPHYVSLMIALNRAKLTPFDEMDWSGWAGAVGKAHMVEFRESDLLFLMKRLGILHWTKEGVVVILDDHGITFNGVHPRGYAAAVEIQFRIGNYDPGVDMDPWYDPDESLEVETNSEESKSPGYGLPPGTRLLTSRPELREPDMPEGTMDIQRPLSERIHAIATDAGLSLREPSIEEILGKAVYRPVDETGVVPGEPGIAPREGSAGTAPSQPTTAPAEQALDAVDGGQTGGAAPAPRPPHSSAMEEAPKDGKTVILLLSPNEGVVGKWSTDFGRQFWVDPDGETLGFDESYIGWVPDSPFNRQSLGLDDE